MAQDIENSTFHELLMFWALEARISPFIRPEDLNKIKKNQGNSLEHMGKHFPRNSETQEFRKFGNLRCTLLEFLNS